MKALISCIPYMMLCILPACNSTRMTGEPGPGVLEHRRSLRQQSLESTNPLPRMKTIEQRVIDFTTGSVTIQAYAPGGSDLPVILLLPSIDFTAGDLVTHNRIARTLAIDTPAVVILPELPQSPEATLQSSVAAASATMDWMTDRIGRLGGAMNCLTVVGEGAAALHTLQLAQRERDRNSTAILGLILITPVFHPHDAPQTHTLGDLPPTFILTGIDGPDRKTALDLAAALDAAGTSTQTRPQQVTEPLRIDWALADPDVYDTVLEVARLVRMLSAACGADQASDTF